MLTLNNGVWTDQFTPAVRVCGNYLGPGRHVLSDELQDVIDQFQLPAGTLSTFCQQWLTQPGLSVIAGSDHSGKLSLVKLLLTVLSNSSNLIGVYDLYDLAEFDEYLDHIYHDHMDFFLLHYHGTELNQFLIGLQLKPSWRVCVLVDRDPAELVRLDKVNYLCLSRQFPQSHDRCERYRDSVFTRQQSPLLSNMLNGQLD